MVTCRQPPDHSWNLEHLHENKFYRQSFSDYVITEAPVFTKRPMRMIVVGAGAAGLQIAYKAERQLENVTVHVYEKNNDIGGTWLENRYPGCTCDIPSHSYQWSFARSPEWTSYYSSAEEIWRYMKQWAVETGIEKYVQFKHTVKQAKWIEEQSIWEVTIMRPDGTVFVDSAEILASCHGVLNTWKYPEIPGIDKFEGKLMHSAAWDSEYDLTDKVVAVIGGGSSAVQIIPSIQKKVKTLYPFLRSPKKEFAENPDALIQYCRDVEGELNKRFTLMHLDSVDQKLSRAYVQKSMEEQLEHDPLLTKQLIPNFALGCRRMTPGSDYLSSLRRPNVEVITQSATEFTKDGIVDALGNERKVDVIICATGFNVTSPAYDIIGQNGTTLKDTWGDFPSAYLSIMTRGFPNMFYFIGPNGPGSHGSILPVIEWHTRYMFKVLTHMQRTSIKYLQPKEAAMKDAYAHTHELLKRTAWSSKCSSWFKNGKTHGPVTAIWPGSRMHYFEVLKEPRYEDFDVEYRDNRFSFLGNGYTSTELDPLADPVWYFDVLREELEKGTKAFDHLSH
ncbi:FAD/NAD(P)-binding domain-containing protein [Stipitochalara longipes BDJ]|nr:FAD/NAD(P)-binding domain-containing protein [Stipitochalara longipes BDJ]